MSENPTNQQNEEKKEENKPQQEQEKKDETQAKNNEQNKQQNNEENKQGKEENNEENKEGNKVENKEEKKEENKEGNQEENKEGNKEENKEEKKEEAEQPPPEKPKGPYDIDERDMTPRFVRAMQVLGYVYSDLQPRTRKDVVQIVKQKDPLLTQLDEELISALKNHLEERRRLKIDDVRKKRLVIQVPQANQSLSITLQDQSQSIIQQEKSIMLDKSIISMSKSILNKSLDPLELEFKIYDKIKKEERAKLFKAQEEEKLLVKQTEYQVKQQLLEERLRNKRKEKDYQRRLGTQQQKEIQQWLHNREDANSSSLFNAQQYIQMVEELKQDMDETLKKRQLLSQQEKIDKVASMNDLRLKETQDLQQMRIDNMQKRLEYLTDLAKKVHNEKQSKEFYDLQRELGSLLKMEKIQIKKELKDEYNNYIKQYNQEKDKKQYEKKLKFFTQQEIMNKFKQQMLAKKNDQLDMKLENFQKLQAESLKKKRTQLKRTTSEQNQNNFSLMKIDYERRIGFQHQMIKEIDRVENITKRKRQEEQYQLDNVILKEQLKEERRSQEISRYNNVVDSMKRFEMANSQSTIKQLGSIKNRHIEREQELQKQIQELKKKEQQDKINSFQKQQKDKIERLQKEIDEEKKKIQEEEKRKKDKEQQEQEQ